MISGERADTRSHVDDIVSDHPDLQPEDIPAALNYAAEALAEHYYPLRPPA